ncbi:hypothetical protein TRICI_000153 [Trichomonascus ciferrii]|uniref:glucan endo-1,3-beta-D-glucosidase n=1 Tax=Trichomonascus ciferrii TaxID=44093 RepID=A0A642VEA7_9ASCO|nr:hypothetical protein TRICI_000153 [Trichomonascus ciferrii]
MVGKTRVFSKTDHSLRCIDSDTESGLDCTTGVVGAGGRKPDFISDASCDYQTPDVTHGGQHTGVTPIANKYSVNVDDFLASDEGSADNSNKKMDATVVKRDTSMLTDTEPASQLISPRKLLSVQYCSTPAVSAADLRARSAMRREHAETVKAVPDIAEEFTSANLPPYAISANPRSADVATMIEYSSLESSGPQLNPSIERPAAATATTDAFEDVDLEAPPTHHDPPDPPSSLPPSPSLSQNSDPTVYRKHVEQNENEKKNEGEWFDRKAAYKVQLKKSLIILLIAALALSILFNIIQALSNNSNQGRQPVIIQPIMNHTQLERTQPSFYTDPDIQEMFGDSALKKVFYGINYTPPNSIYPQCGVDQKQVAKDIATLSQLTNRVRLFSTDCEQADMVLNAIQGLGVNMTVSMGLWVNRFAEVTVRQLANMRRILNKYPSKLINSIILGNEVLFRDDLSDQELIGFIEYVKEYLERKGLHIPVGTSEVGFKWSPGLASHVDIMGVNIQPFFGGADVNRSLTWTYDYLLEEISTKRTSRNTEIVLSEVGWPIKGDPLHLANPGIQQLQLFLDNWVCANQNSDVGWYWHEAFDTPWNDLRKHNYWGILGDDNKLKPNLTLPDCSH